MSHNPNFPKGLKKVFTISGDVAVKVTGANLGKITHLVSLDAEQDGEQKGLRVGFDTDGSLAHVTFIAGDVVVTAKRGDYLLRTADGLLFLAPAAEFDKVAIAA